MILISMIIIMLLIYDDINDKDAALLKIEMIVLMTSMQIVTIIARVKPPKTTMLTTRGCESLLASMLLL